jgi:Skp family chaperone for outer membrane proteins
VTKSHFKLAGSWITLVALVCVLAGCDDGSSDVAVVDLGRLAEALGRDTPLKEAIQQMNAKLQKVQGQLKSQMDAKRMELGDSPTQEQKEAFQRVAQQAQQQAMRNQQQAQQIVNVQRARVLAKLKQDSQSYVRQVADERGHTLVLAPGDILLAANPTADITDVVISLMKPALGAMPELQNLPGDSSFGADAKAGPSNE